MAEDRRSTPAEHPGGGDADLGLTGRMRRATAHVQGGGVRVDAIPGLAEPGAVGHRRRLAAVAAAVALVAGGAAAVVGGGDAPEEVVTGAPGAPDSDDPGGPSDGDASGDPGDVRTTSPTRVLESGPTIPLGPCHETYPVPVSTIGLEARITFGGDGMLRVGIRNTTDEEVVVLNGGRFVALTDDGSIRTDIYEGMTGATTEVDDPPVAVPVAAGGRGEIHTPIALVQSTASCPGAPTFLPADPLVPEHPFVYLLGVEGSGEVYATDVVFLEVHGDGSASCTGQFRSDGSAESEHLQAAVDRQRRLLDHLDLLADRGFVLDEGACW